MSGTDENRPVGKSGRRNKKGEPRRQKQDSQPGAAPVQLQSPEPDVQIPPEPVQVQSPQIDPQPTLGEHFDEVPSPDVSPAAAAPAEPAPVSLQTLANAYRDYTRKSFEEFGSYFEQLTGVRSLDKAMEVQTEFVKRAYESSVAEPRKIRGQDGGGNRTHESPQGNVANGDVVSIRTLYFFGLSTTVTMGFAPRVWYSTVTCPFVPSSTHTWNCRVTK